MGRLAEIKLCSRVRLAVCPPIGDVSSDALTGLGVQHGCGVPYKAEVKRSMSAYILPFSRCSLGHGCDVPCFFYA